MSEYPAYMNTPGTLTKILTKIKAASTPEKFTYDFLSTELGFKGGSPRAFVPFAKKIKLIETDGSPTDLYNSFRNKAQSGAAVAKMMRHGFAKLYRRNEYAHRLSNEDLKGLVVEITGLKESDSTVRAIIGTFNAMKALAKFDETSTTADDVESEHVETDDQAVSNHGQMPMLPQSRISLGYTINLNLPATRDIEVFNAIFKSLKEHLL